MIPRLYELPEKNSFFLFGARGTGKTTFLQSHYNAQNSLYIDLLDPKHYNDFLLNPERFEQLISQEEHRNKTIVIDEIQLLPQLLNTVHRHIQKDKRQFVLTGSSSRRLKQKGVNLLAGRAWVHHMHPFSSWELDKKFDLTKMLHRGALPDAYLADNEKDCQSYLNAYANTYLEKEIQHEQWVKRLAPFRKFLKITAQMNGNIINKAKLARDIGVDPSTVAAYFEILQDTLIGFSLPAYHTSIRKAQRQGMKFYLFDIGVKRALDQSIYAPLQKQSYAWGQCFEHFIVLEIVKLIAVFNLPWQLYHLRTKNSLEIDLIIDRPGQGKICIEIKSKHKVSKQDAKSLLSLSQDINQVDHVWLLSCDPLQQQFEKCQAIHWQEAIGKLYQDQIG